MNTVQINVPKCPEWFLRIHESEPDIDLPKVENYFSDVYLDLYIETERGAFHFKPQYEKLKEQKTKIGHDISDGYWIESGVLSYIFGRFIPFNSHVFYQNDCDDSKIKEEPAELRTQKKRFNKACESTRIEFNEWKLKEQERIHTAWMEYFFKLSKG